MGNTTEPPPRRAGPAEVSGLAVDNGSGRRADVEGQILHLDRIAGAGGGDDGETVDAGVIDEDGYVFIMARTDDIINVAGHRLSTGAMEEVIASHADIAECAVVGKADALKGQMPLGFFVTNDGADRDPAELERELVQLVRAKIGCA